MGNALYMGQGYAWRFGLYNYGARFYDAELGRFFATDPAQQFHSPYVGMGNNSVSMIQAFLSTLALAQVDCDSIFEHYNQLRADKVGLFMYEKAPELISDKEKLVVIQEYKEDTGKVFILFVVDKEGKAICTEVVNSNNEELDKEALALIHSLEFSPAMHQGIPRFSTMTLLITFLHKEKTH